MIDIDVDGEGLDILHYNVCTFFYHRLVSDRLLRGVTAKVRIRARVVAVGVITNGDECIVQLFIHVIYSVVFCVV